MAAGTLRDGVLTVTLVAAAGTWYPERGDGPGHEVYAFGESAGDLRNPGPLLRVPAGTEIRATLQNRIPDAGIVVRGLHGRPGATDTIHVPAGGTRLVRFRVDSAGTYYYWATSRGARSVVARFGPESQLHGALIVDPPGAVPPDRVFVIGIEDDSAGVPADRPLRAAVVNGLSWPHSEPATTRVGDTLRMRWINASDRRHPMHLHGFFFRVESRGDGARDSIYTPAQHRLAVTELMQPGGTFTMSWVPERPGNWLMHCHMTEHIAPELRSRPPSHAHGAGGVNHALDVMSGLVMGWRVLPGPSPPRVEPDGPAPRRLRLSLQPAGRTHGTLPGLGAALLDEAAGSVDPVQIPGPPLVLARGRPARIRVVNLMEEATTIHWHGMELDSYFDGVSGWSGEQGRTAPAIEPGDSFDVSFTPPRSGTFMYHSHFNEERQLASGLFGPLIVLEPDERYDPGTDRSWILSQGGLDFDSPILVNGSDSPQIEVTAGRPHRIRLINISPSIPLTFELSADSTPVMWRALAKDGADLPAAQARSQPAILQIGVGETYDFELVPDAARPLGLRILDPAGAVRRTGTVRVRRRASRPAARISGRAD